MPSQPPLDPQSTRPYLVRAIYEWCTDHGFTPYVAVQVDETVQVPREYVRNGEIVLNVSFEATSGLKLGNEFIEFKARFGGVSREIMVPMHRVLAIYALENGQGMSFPVAPPAISAGPVRPGGSADDGRPRLSLAGAPTAPAVQANTSARVLQLVGQSERTDDMKDAESVPASAENLTEQVSTNASLTDLSQETHQASATPSDDAPPPAGPQGPGRPSLKLVK